MPYLRKVPFQILKVFGRIYVLVLVLSSTAISQENYRPEYHFTPSENWMNDPNGMFYFDGTYHLYFQYNPFGDQWGNMSWGHATSNDLINWTEHDLAIPFENGIMAFSGSCVVDWQNTSGFGDGVTPPIIAIYTGYDVHVHTQDQRIAYSLDGGFTFNQYDQNPVITLNNNEFRDPKVIWHEDTDQWIMVVSKGNEKKIAFYKSTNLLQWEWLQDFGPIGNVNGAWECPDLFELPIENLADSSAWALVHSVGPGIAQYFIGDFDGNEFKLSNSESTDEDILFEDFEGGNYDGWAITGEAFGSAPANGTLGGQQTVSGFLGNGLINTFIDGDGPTGEALSDAFTISREYINFLLGGGDHINETYIVLEVDGQEVRRSTSRNNELLINESWNVAEFIGQTARIRIVDNRSGGWGHINVDHIVFSDKLPTISDVPLLDYGTDFYAVQSFSDAPDDRKTWMAWMNNWTYANQVPTSPFRGMMSIARDVSLVEMNGKIVLTQRPSQENYMHWQNTTSFTETDVVAINDNLKNYKNNAFALEAVVSTIDTDGFYVLLNFEGSQSLVIDFDFKESKIILNRSNCGDFPANNLFNEIQEAPLHISEDICKLEVFVDKCSVELFQGDGKTILSNQIFADFPFSNVAFLPKGTPAGIDMLTYYTNEPTTSVAENIQEKISFEISPNPSNDLLKIHFGEYSYGDDLNIEIFESAGQKVSACSISNSTHTINVSEYKPGIYWVVLSTKDHGIVTKPFIKQ